MVEIAIAGRSNVGKSSIIREITGKKPETGKKPGVTREINELKLGKKLEMVDLPGFGYIAGLSEKEQEKIKTKIVRYLENNTDQILFAVEIIDTSMFLEIAQRWKKKGQIPIDVELFSFLQEIELKPILAANKIDKIKSKNRDETLDKICTEIGLNPPWRQWLDIIVPTSAKTGEGINKLKQLMRDRFKETGKENLLKYF